MTVGNFKSVRDELDVELGDLTVVTGSNSSGKSTLLQALLLLSQTLRYSATDRQLVLNGPLTRLGELLDVLNDGGSGRELEIGVCVVDTQQGQQTRHRTVLPGARPSSVAAEWRFGARPVRAEAPESTSLYPTVASASVVAQFGADDAQRSVEFLAKRHKWSVERRVANEGLTEEPSDQLRDGLAWSCTSSGVTGESPLAGARGVLFDHFVPVGLAVREDANELMARRQLRALCGQRALGMGWTDPVQPELWHLVAKVLQESGLAWPTDRDDPPSPSSFADWARTLSPTRRRELLERLRLDTDSILKAFQVLGSKRYFLNQSALPDEVSAALDLVVSAISGVRYLGPLRAQPSPLYSSATTLGSTDLGPSGEWTAAVLDTHKNRIVEFIHPDAIPLRDESTAQVGQPLGEAVDTWMRYLGVSGGVQTSDRGSIGHELRVATSTTNRSLPLTHVGVGVSQCLPVVVSLLLAPPGSITLLEQPELHLHPAVQSRLTDFLLAMALSGRQVLVETHSEYLVNRLRLRIAQSAGASVADGVRTYFASIVDGVTSFERVEVNEYGVIQNWPKGFFDQAQDEVELLLRESMAKRSRGTGHASGGD